MGTRPISRFLTTLAIILAVSCTANRSEKVENTPLMGWSSWNAYMVNISDSIICHEADMLVSTGLRDAGYSQVDIDDGFFGPRTAEGKMTSHPVRFPSGMKGVVDHIHSLGMKAGTYSDAGSNTCGSIYNKDTLGNGAGLYGHDVQDAELYFNEWGFDFIKIDYCGGSKLQLDEKERYLEIRRNIDSVAHRKIAINLCRWAFPGTWAEEAGASWRTTADIRPNWNSIKTIIGINLYLSGFSRNGHYNDMDMLAIGYEGNQSGLGTEDAFILTEDYLEPDEEDAHFGMWCIMNSPLLIGCKLSGIPQRSLDLLRNEELIALNQDPLGIQARVVRHEGETYVLAKDLIRRQGPKRGVALYNPADCAATVSVSPEELGYSGSLEVRDLLRHEDLGTFDAISLDVPAHGVRMLTVEGKRCEQRLYEAEWAYLPEYSAIKQGPYIWQHESASGKVFVDGLGGSRSNCITWEDVWSDKGGRYTLELGIVPTPRCMDSERVELSVNGKVIAPDESNLYEIKLRKGLNTVTLTSDAEMPGIDFISLRK